MSSRDRTYIERDRHGRERFVVSRSGSHRRSASQTRVSLRDLLDEAEVRAEAQVNEIRVLQDKLSAAQRDQWHLQHLRAEHQKVVNEHFTCRHLHSRYEKLGMEFSRIEKLLVDEEEKVDTLIHRNEKLEEKVRLVKRASHESDGLREAYEQRVLEVEVFRQRLVERDREIRDRDDGLRLAQTRIEEKNTRIVYLKEFIRSLGYRVED